MLRVYGTLLSGNCYKVRLLLHQLEQPFEWVEIDILKGESRTPEFLRKNPNGRVPVLEIEPGTTLAESNAILCYLAEGTSLLPDERLSRARVLQWLCFEQYSHEPFIATSRFILAFQGDPPERRRELREKRAPGQAALAVMQEHLAAHPFFVEDRYSIADIGLFAYTHVAHEGGFDLAPYPAVRAWIERVEAQPRHIAITET